MTGSLDDPLSLNRYEYARDNPETLIDPNGHMFEYYNSGAGGIGAPITNENLNDESGNTIAVLLQDRNNPFLIPTASQQQHGPPVPSISTTTISKSSSSPSEECVGTFAPPGTVCGYSGQDGAIAVTAFFFIVGAGLAIATPFALLASGPGGLIVGAAAIGSFYGGGAAAAYDLEEGNSATPEGAFNQGMAGVTNFVQEVMDVFSF